jgi:hypothetical protein
MKSYKDFKEGFAHPNHKKLDANGNGKVDAEDFKLLRKKKHEAGESKSQEKQEDCDMKESRSSWDSNMPGYKSGMGRDHAEWAREKTAGEDDDEDEPKSSYKKPYRKPYSAPATSGKIFHKVPFAKKDDAKAEGMRWDSASKKWYHTDTNKSKSSAFMKESVFDDARKKQADDEKKGVDPDKEYKLKMTQAQNSQRVRKMLAKEEFERIDEVHMYHTKKTADGHEWSVSSIEHGQPNKVLKTGVESSQPRAVTAAKKHIKSIKESLDESLEEIFDKSEKGRKKLDSYISKADDSLVDMAKNRKDGKKPFNRSNNLSKAIDKRMKEEVELTEGGWPNKGDPLKTTATITKNKDGSTTTTFPDGTWKIESKGYKAEKKPTNLVYTHSKSDVAYQNLVYKKGGADNYQLNKEEVDLDEELDESEGAEKKKSLVDMLNRMYKKADENTKLQKNRAIKKPILPKGVKEEVEELEEAKKEPMELYHPSYSSAVQHAKAHAEKQGYEISDDDWHNNVTTGPGKPGRGKTTRHVIPLHKDGKLSKKGLAIQVHNRETDKNPYELNSYIN